MRGGTLIDIGQNHIDMIGNLHWAYVLRTRKKKRKLWYQMRYPHDIKYPSSVHTDIIKKGGETWRYWFVLYHRKHYPEGSTTAQDFVKKKMHLTLANRWILTNV